MNKKMKKELTTKQEDFLLEQAREKHYKEKEINETFNDDLDEWGNLK